MSSYVNVLDQLLSSGKIDQREHENRLVEWVSFKIGQSLQGALPSKEEVRQSRSSLLNDIDDATSTKLTACEARGVEVEDIELIFECRFDKSLKVFKFESLKIHQRVNMQYPVRWIDSNFKESPNE